MAAARLFTPPRVVAGTGPDGSVLLRAAELDAGEITDKGYVNQRRVLERRAALVELLYADPAPAGVIVADPSA